jgi:hypothetical protein
MELPPPPDEGWTDEDEEAFKHAKALLDELLPAIQLVNAWTDGVVKRVDPDQLPRHKAEKMTGIVWQAELIERVLKHTIPAMAMMDILHYVKLNAGDEQVMVKEISTDEAKRLGYL